MWPTHREDPHEVKKPLEKAELRHLGGTCPSHRIKGPQARHGLCPEGRRMMGRQPPCTATGARGPGWDTAPKLGGWEGFVGKQHFSSIIHIRERRHRLH